MAVLAQEHLDRLRNAGLLISSPYSPTHAAFPDGVAVGKPTTVPGNSIENYRLGWGFDGTMLDAPLLWVHPYEGKWYVVVAEYAPGPGPGDFVDVWRTEQEAVDDILDFFFGNPARMDIKRKARGL